MQGNDALRREREARNWLQRDVAKQLCINERTYRRWERENQYPRLTSIKKLCDLFEKKPEELGFYLYTPDDM